MNKDIITAIDLKDFKVDDHLWSEKMELVRKEVIPYLWNAINDKTKDAIPSFCLENFRIAAKVLKSGRDANDLFRGPIFQDSYLYKWIEAVAYSITNHPDEKLEKSADEAIDIICEAQCDDGYLNTYYIINGLEYRFTDLRDMHELYCFGYLIDSAIAYYKATGKDKLMQAAIKMANLLCDYFGPEPDKCHGYPGYEVCESSLIQLYKITGEKKYLELSIFFIEERGESPNYFISEESHNDNFDPTFNQSHLPVRDQLEAVGNSIRAINLYYSMSDLAHETRDETLFTALKTLWDSAVREKMYITGGFGSSRVGEAFSYPFDLPNSTAFAETDASISFITWASRMVHLDTHNIYPDTLELALYNTILSSMSLDGKRFFHTNPLEVNPEACHKNEVLSHVRTTRQKRFEATYCPTNLAAFISSLPTYAYAKSKDTLYMYLYIGGTLHTALNGHEVTFNIDSSYPNDDEITITYNGEQISDIKLAIRIPRWNKNYRIEADKQIVEVIDGFAYISGEFSDGDQITVTLPMTPKLYAVDPRVVTGIRKVALLRGPVVYCIESIDNGKELKNLKVSSKFSNETVALGYVNINMHSILSVDIPGLRIEKIPEKVRLYQPYEATTYTPIILHFIPYYAWANRGETEMAVWVNMEHK